MKTLITVTLFFASFHALAASNEQSFTPNSIMKPIYEISLVDTSDAAHKIRYYQCNSNDPANCMVDIQNQPQLDDMLQTNPKIAAAHDYDAITIRHCASSEGRGYTAYVKGEWSFNSSTQRYYTSGDADPITMEGPATESKVFIAGCQTTFRLPHTINVGAKNVPNVRLFRMNDLLAYARLNATTASTHGCNEYSAFGVLTQRHSVCMHNPEVYPYIASGPNAIIPALEQYSVSRANSNGAPSAMFTLIVDRNENARDGTNVVAATARTLYSFGSTEIRGNFNGLLNPVVDNADHATMVLDNDSIRFEEFKRARHDGIYSVLNQTGNPTEAYSVTPAGETPRNGSPSYATSSL